MDNRQKEIDNLKDYKYGFTTDIENTRAPKGLNEDVIKFISTIKKERSFLIVEINFITSSFNPLGALVFSISVVKPYL